MTDIVERLRAGFQCDEIGNRCRTMDAKSGCVCAEAADEIERLEAALREIIGMDEVAIVEFKKGDGWLHQRVARAALEGKQ